MFNKLRRRNINRIIEDNLDYLVRFAYYRLSNRVEAEDVVYEAVLKILEREAGDIQPGSVRMYLFRTVHNLCLDRSREKGREPLSPLPTLKINVLANKYPNKYPKTDFFGYFSYIGCQ